MLSDEQREIRDLAHQFAAGEIRPHTARWDAEAALDDGIFGSLAELGFLGMRVPESHGGLELDLPTWLLVLEELAWGDAAVALGVGTHGGPVTGLLLAHGSEAQKEAWLPRLAGGEILGVLAPSGPVTEPDDLESRAERDGDGWRLSGRLPWVTHGARAGLMLAFARTGEGSVGCFLLDTGDDGVQVGGRRTTMGFRAAGAVDVELDGARAEALGVPDDGLRLAEEALGLARVGMAAIALGVGRAAMEHATEYALERRQFGHSIADFGAIQAKLADMAGRIDSARALMREVGAALHARYGQRGESSRGAGMDGEGDLTARAALVKVMASEAAMWVSDEAVQVFGGYGYMRDYPVEKLMRDAKGTEIHHGTSESLRRVVAGAILRAASGGAS